MRKYMNILYGFFKASAIADLEYRLNIVMKVVTDIIWYLAQVSVFEVIFRNVDQVGGWNLHSARVFIAALFVVDSIWMLLFSENLDRLSDKVRRGELDLLLSKPVNSQFMMSFQRLSTPYLINILITIGYLNWAFFSLPEPPSGWRLLMLIVLVPCSLMITYGMRFFFSAAALIFARAENINYIWWQFYRLGMRPDALYPPWLRYIVLTVIPVGFLASVPARLILGSNEWGFIVAAIGLGAFMVWVSTRFWAFALKRYSSASS